jgi:hypothetical protein
MSYEEEDTCHMRRRRRVDGPHGRLRKQHAAPSCHPALHHMSYEEEDT